MVKSQPGRPPKEQMIAQLMRSKKLTRAQAKAEIKAFDAHMVQVFIAQIAQAALAESVKPSKVKPLTKSVFSSMGYQI